MLGRPMFVVVSLSNDCWTGAGTRVKLLARAAITYRTFLCRLMGVVQIHFDCACPACGQKNRELSSGRPTLVGHSTEAIPPGCRPRQRHGHARRGCSGAELLSTDSVCHRELWFLVGVNGPSTHIANAATDRRHQPSVIASSPSRSIGVREVNRHAKISTLGSSQVDLTHEH